VGETYEGKKRIVWRGRGISRGGLWCPKESNRGGHQEPARTHRCTIRGVKNRSLKKIKGGESAGLVLWWISLLLPGKSQKILVKKRVTSLLEEKSTHLTEHGEPLLGGKNDSMNSCSQSKTVFLGGKVGVS